MQTFFDMLCISLLVGFLAMVGIEGMVGVQNILYIVRWH